MNRRREFLGQMGAALVAAPLLGCKKPVQKQAVLEALVRDLVIPDVHAVLARSQALEETAGALVQSPSAAALERARADWRAAVVAWKRAYCFRNGPLVTTGAFLQGLFWPVRAQSVEALTRGERGIDDKLVRELGVDEKGLYALEHLLFSVKPEGGSPALGDTPAADRARKLVGVVARAVTARAAAAVRVLGDGRAYAAAFAAQGQQSLNLLANQIVETVETVADGRIARMIERDGLPPKPHEIEGLPSAMAFEIPRVLIEGTRALYIGTNGNGLGALVEAIAPDIDTKARAAFSHASATLAALSSAPVDGGLQAQRPAIETAAQATKALELAFKVEVCSVLGVTLTFVGGDGD